MAAFAANRFNASSLGAVLAPIEAFIFALSFASYRNVSQEGRARCSAMDGGFSHHRVERRRYSPEL
jgi:hypothetical protein